MRCLSPASGPCPLGLLLEATSTTSTLGSPEQVYLYILPTPPYFFFLSFFFYTNGSKVNTVITLLFTLNNRSWRLFPISTPKSLFFLQLLFDSCVDVSGELLIVNQYNGKLLQGFAVMNRSSWHRIEQGEKNQNVAEHIYYRVYIKQNTYIYIRISI